MWHAFVLYGTPEAKEALNRINEFIDEHLTN
jgi:acetyl esterase/lipase